MKTKVKYIKWKLILCILLFSCTPEEIKINEFSDVFITWSPLTINVDGEVSFADGSRGVKERLWIFPGDGIVQLVDAANHTTSTERIVHAVFKKPGEYDVRLQASFNDPSVSLDSLIHVNVLENVKAGFSSDARMENGSYVVEAGRTVTYTTRSTGSPDTFLWYLEGGEPEEGSGSEITIQYNYPGTWDVTLIAYRNNPKGRDTLTVRNYITVVRSGAE